MRLRPIGPLLALLLAAPLVAFAEPPDHAPAHGYRAKQKGPASHDHVQRAPRGGIEIIYDSGRGVHVAVGLPDIFFDGGHYYRKHEGHWEVSANGRDGWRPPSFGVPMPIVKATTRGPVPAKRSD